MLKLSTVNRDDVGSSPTLSAYMKNTTKLTDEKIEEILQFYDAGNSANKTAKEKNVGKATVLKYIHIRDKVETDEELTLKRHKNNVKVKKRRKKLKELAVEYKGGKCQNPSCGYDRCMEAMDFHHINPEEKDFGISSKGFTRSWDKVKQELDKCVMLCANCHREVHAGVLDINDIPQ